MTSKDHQSQVQALLKDIATFEHQTKDVYANEALRARLLQSAKRLVSALEKPGDAVFDNAFLVIARLLFQRCGLAPNTCLTLAGPEYVCEDSR